MLLTAHLFIYYIISTFSRECSYMSRPSTPPFSASSSKRLELTPEQVKKFEINRLKGYTNVSSPLITLTLRSESQTTRARHILVFISTTKC